ncbi:MAG: HK97 family phage prohead protease [Clostridia bacterium]|nr:HK97 family phage prohead protease [Clostridia bacterium]
MTKCDCPLEIREVRDDGTFTGYGSVFGVIDAYGDSVQPGAFAKSLKNKTPALLWQHDSSQPIGVWEDIREDEHGLLMRGRLLVGKVARATEARELLKAGAISGLSIGYVPVEWDYVKAPRDGDEKAKSRVRRLKEIDLWEVSLVTFPANDAARVTGVKNLATIQDVEESLRDAGYSRTEAKSLISRIKDLQRDAEFRSHAVETVNSLINHLKGM